MVKSYESVVYEQKKALQSWRKATANRGLTDDPELNELVWELFLLFGDILSAPSEQIEEDIYKTAYELAQRTLDHFEPSEINNIYRDLLVDAILWHTELHSDAMKRLARFTNLLSDAFAEANSDKLKKQIRHQRAERVSDELRMAKRIQQHLLPKHLPSIPGFEFAGRLVPASEVGGDYWSIKYYPEDGVVTMKLADVSGHGIAAATLVAAVKFVSGGYYKSAHTPAEVVEYTNHVLVKETPSEILITMVYGWLKPESREIVLVNAGHEPVFMCKAGKCIDILPTGTVMGLDETDYGETTIRFDPGDVFIVCSDGVMDAGIGEPFGVVRLKELVVENREKSAEEIADIVINAVTEYAGVPHDDMSLLVIRCTP